MVVVVGVVEVITFVVVVASVAFDDNDVAVWGLFEVVLLLLVIVLGELVLVVEEAEMSVEELSDVSAAVVAAVEVIVVGEVVVVVGLGEMVVEVDDLDG